jgi:hypothetical protein
MSLKHSAQFPRREGSEQTRTSTSLDKLEVASTAMPANTAIECVGRMASGQDVEKLANEPSRVVLGSGIGLWQPVNANRACHGCGLAAALPVRRDVLAVGVATRRFATVLCPRVSSLGSWKAARDRACALLCALGLDPQVSTKTTYNAASVSEHTRNVCRTGLPYHRAAEYLATLRPTLLLCRFDTDLHAQAVHSKRYFSTTRTFRLEICLTKTCRIFPIC